MKKNKLLAIALSFALVFTMCAASTAAAFAAQQDGVVKVSSPQKVWVNGEDLESGEYYKSDGSTGSSSTPPGHRICLL